jgi:hypothetical protein
MNTTGSGWSTSSFGDSTDTKPGELDALGRHLHECRRLSGRWFQLRCAADAVHVFVAGRFVTSLLALALLAGLAALLL